MNFRPTLDQDFIDVSTELVGAMRDDDYTPFEVLEVLIGAIIIVKRESKFFGDIKEAAEIIQRAIVKMDDHIYVVSAH